MTLLKSIESKFFHSEIPYKPMGKYVHFLTVRVTESYPLFQTDGELNMIKKDGITVPRLKGSQLPYKATEGSAAYDLRAPVNATVMPGGRLVLDLNLSAAIPEGYALQLSSRSGLASQGLWTLAGVIDSDYRGSIKAILFNSNSSAFKIAKGQRITQAFLFRTFDIDWQEVEELPSTSRGEGGLGSTGKL